MKQQVVQIQWIDALLNSNKGFYPFLRFVRSVIFVCFDEGSKPEHKILDLIHNRNQGESTHVSVDSENEKVEKDLRSKLDNLCIE